MKITIKVTKDILRKSMMCNKATMFTSRNCAIALAVREIAPLASVYFMIDWGLGQPNIVSKVPQVAWDFIQTFDKLESIPEKRLELPEFSFEVDFPDELMEMIGIEEVKDILSKSETLSEAI